MFNRLPAITKNLLIINILFFLATWVLEARGIFLDRLLGLHFFMTPDFHFYQFFTYMFLHAGWMHILSNMFGLWMFGYILENVWGPKKFLFYYIVCGVGAGIIQEIAQFFDYYMQLNAQGIGLMEMITHSSLIFANGAGYTVGASGAVYAILLAFGMTFPEERIFIFPFPVPIKAKWFVMIYVGIELFSALGTPGDNVAHTAHLGGMLFGYLLIRYWRNHSGSSNYSASFINDTFNNLRGQFNKYKQESRQHKEEHRQDTTSRETDWEYNARKKAEQDEIDRILDKIRKSGYDSLTSEEKKKLFDSSNKF